MDIVYVCRSGPNEELRYSLRSLRNLPHHRVWIFGAWPDWVRGAECVKVPLTSGDRYARSYANLVAALEHPEVGEKFVLMCDDIFVMSPWRGAVYHRGEIDAAVETQYWRRIKQMGVWLATHGRTTLNYEVHAPFVFSKQELAEVVALEIGRERYGTIRTLYGNWHGIGGEVTEDFKVRTPFTEVDRELLSTSDATFGRRYVGDHIRVTFDEPSVYEGDA